MKLTHVDMKTFSILNLSEIDDNLYEVNRINVPFKHRGKGIGRELMKAMIENADEEKATLVLDINPYGEMTYNDLRSWYERNGFKKVNSRFVRKPQ